MEGCEGVGMTDVDDELTTGLAQYNAKRQSLSAIPVYALTAV